MSDPSNDSICLTSLRVRQTIRKCNAVAQRSKGSGSKNSDEIRCTQRDLETGIEYYLVGISGYNSCRWVSSLDVAPGPLVGELTRRKNLHADSLVTRVRAEAAKKQTTTSGTFRTLSHDKPQPPDVYNTSGNGTVLANHKRQAKYLIETYGLSLIPNGQLESLRLTALARLQTFYARKGLQRTKKHILEEIATAEFDVVDVVNAASMETLENILPTAQISPLVLPSAPVTPSKFIGEVSQSSNSQIALVEGQAVTFNSPAASSLVSISAPVVDHIEGSISFGARRIPVHESASIRKMNEYRFSRAMQVEGTTLDTNHLKELVGRAQANAFSHVSSTERDITWSATGTQQPPDVSGGTRRGCNAAADRLSVNHGHYSSQPSSTPTSNQSVQKISSNPAGAQSYPARGVAMHVYPRHSATHFDSQHTAEDDFSILQYASRQQQPTGPMTTSADVANRRCTAVARAAGSSLNEYPPGDLVWSPHGEAGTPVNLVQQIVAQHKDATRALLRRFGLSIPPSELQPLRRKYISKLTDVVRAAGILSSDETIYAILVEAEAVVLGEEPAVRTDWAQSSGLFSATLEDSAASLCVQGQPSVPLPSPRDWAIDRSGTRLSSALRQQQTSPQQQQWQHAVRQPHALSLQQPRRHCLEHDRQHHLHRGEHEDGRDTDVLNVLARQFPTLKQVGESHNFPRQGDSYEPSTYRSQDPPNFIPQPYSSPPNIQHDIAWDPSVASMSAGHGHGWYQQGFSNGNAASNLNAGQSNDQPSDNGPNIDLLDWFQKR